MKSTHLSDEILQAYLLKEIQDDSTAAHLAECAMCRQKLEDYQVLMSNMPHIKTESFSFDVTAVVMNNITLYEKKKSQKQELVFWGLLIFLSIGIASFSIPYIPEILAAFSKSVLTTLLVAGTGLSVLLFLLADIFRQYKSKEEKLFQSHLQPTL